MTPPQQATEAVPETLLLDVGVAVFAANIPNDYDEQIKRTSRPKFAAPKATIIAYTLKTMLQSTGNWGAVRVVPQTTNAVDVIVGGTILNSDGARLQLEAKWSIRAATNGSRKSTKSLSSKYAYDANVPQEHRPVPVDL